MSLRLALLASVIAVPAVAQEVNIYSYRQPELIQPLLDGFTEATGIATNSAFVDKGMIERLLAERRSMEDGLSDRRSALTECLKELRPDDRTLISNSYAPGAKFKEVAQRLNRSAGALYKSLGRIRRS